MGEAEEVCGNGVARSMNFRASFLSPEFSVSSSKVTQWEKQSKLNVLRKIAPKKRTQSTKRKKKTDLQLL